MIVKIGKHKIKLTGRKIQKLKIKHKPRKKVRYVEEESAIEK